MDFDEFLEQAEILATAIRLSEKTTQEEALRFVLYNRDMFVELQGYNKVMKIRK